MGTLGSDTNSPAPLAHQIPSGGASHGDTAIACSAWFPVYQPNNLIGWNASD